MDKNEIAQLFEIGGHRAEGRYRSYNRPEPQSGNRFDRRDQRSTPSPSGELNIRDMDPWQKELYVRIRKGSDVFVNVNPAGGKTLPLLLAWRNSFEHRSGTQSNPRKILWVTPRVQLANQIYHQDLIPSILNQIALWQRNPQNNVSFFPINILPYDVVTDLMNNNMTLSRESINSLRNWIHSEAVILKARGQSSGNITPNTLAAVCTYNYSRQFMNELKPSLIVIDEVQEYVPIRPEEDDELSEKVKNFVGILKAASRNTSIVLLTGSMNGNTAQQISDYLNKTFRRKFEVFQRSARNRSYINIIPNSRLDGNENKVSLIKDAIRTRDIGNTLVMFSIKKERDEFKNTDTIMGISRKLVDSLPKRSISKVTGVRLDERDVPIEDDDYYANLKRQQHRHLDRQMSKKEEEEERKNLQTSSQQISGMKDDPKHWAARLKYMLNYGPPKNINKDTQPDNFLAQCILAGFGYIVGQGARGFKMENDDIMLVQSLFKAGKIYFILATDSIGVGTTLTINKLYLPKISKFSTGGGSAFIRQLDTSSLVQLVNRVGRKPTISAEIHCHPDDFETIVSVLSNDPASQVEPSIFGKGRSELEKQSGTQFSKIRSIFRLISNK